MIDHGLPEDGIYLILSYVDILSLIDRDGVL